MNIYGAFSGYSINDVAACKEFYRDTLGLATEDEIGGLRFDVGGQKVFVYPKTDHQPANYTVLNFVVENIDVAIDELKSKGIEFEYYDTLPAPQDERGVLRGLAAGMGPDIAWFKDPSDNILALVQEK